jgi:putative hydrolase of HD superfamily
MNIDLTDPILKEAVDFHGHLCPGLLIGYRAARALMARLDQPRSEDEELVAVVENDSCSVDGIQYITGCTFGKGNLVFRNWGKQVFTLAVRPDGRAVRAAFIGDRLKTEDAEGRTDREAFARALLEAEDQALFSFSEPTVHLPRKARIFPTVPCDDCGEGVMEPRLARVRGRLICPECLTRQDPEVLMSQVADFAFEIGMLKKTPRTGYQFLGNGSETVAQHAFRAAVIALVLGRLDPEADALKTMQMTLLHDLAEARTGDHNYVNKQYVSVDEERAEADAAGQAPCGREIEALLAEFRRGESREAILAHDADQLDMIFELKEKKDLGNRYAEAWLYYAEKRLKTDLGRDLCRAALETDWTNWWFTRKEHLWVRND